MQEQPPGQHWEAKALRETSWCRPLPILLRWAPSPSWDINPWGSRGGEQTIWQQTDGLISTSPVTQGPVPALKAAQPLRPTSRLAMPPVCQGQGLCFGAFPLVGDCWLSKVALLSCQSCSDSLGEAEGAVKQGTLVGTGVWPLAAGPPPSSPLRAINTHDANGKCSQTFIINYRWIIVSL